MVSKRNKMFIISYRILRLNLDYHSPEKDDVDAHCCEPDII